MTTAASIGNGAQFQIEGSTPGTFTAIAEVFDITPPNETTDVIDTTHMGSPGGVREYILGLTDPGEASFEMNFVPGSASEALILTTKAERKAKNFRIVFPNAATWTFAGLLTGYEPAMPNDDKMTATVTIKVTGAVLREAGE